MIRVYSSEITICLCLSVLHSYLFVLIRHSSYHICCTVGLPLNISREVHHEWDGITAWTWEYVKWIRHSIRIRTASPISTNVLNSKLHSCPLHRMTTKNNSNNVRINSNDMERVGMCPERLRSNTNFKIVTFMPHSDRTFVTMRTGQYHIACSPQVVHIPIHPCHISGYLYLLLSDSYYINMYS